MASYLMVLLVLILSLSQASCGLPVATKEHTIVPIYVIDERTIGGKINVTLEKPYLTGNGEAERHVEIHYVSPEIAKKLAENPALAAELIKK